MTLARKASRRPSEPGWIYQKEAGVMLTFLKSERTIDYLRWTAAVVAVVLTYGVTAWMVLRPAGWRLDADGPVVEINLRDMPQTPAIPPSDRASEPATDPTGDNAQRALSDSADTAPRVAGASASRADAGRDADTDAKDGPPDAPKTAALDQAENPSITQPRSSADSAAEAPPKTEAPAADSGGGGRPTTIPPRVVTPDTSATASIGRAPIDTSITVNQGRSLLRSAKGRSQLSVLALPQLNLTPPLAILKDRNEPFAKKPPPFAGLTLQAIAPAANHGHADLAAKPAMGDITPSCRKRARPWAFTHYPARCRLRCIQLASMGRPQRRRACRSQPITQGRAMPPPLPTNGGRVTPVQSHRWAALPSMEPA
jgi:hypothetical protein